MCYEMNLRRVPAETLRRKKYNPTVMPTSIIFLNESVASEVFGFTVKYVDYNVKSKVATTDDVLNFEPHAQAKIDK